MNTIDCGGGAPPVQVDTPNDAARPACYITQELLADLVNQHRCTAKVIAADQPRRGNYWVPLYTAADYDALRAERDRLREECAERKRLAFEQANNVLEQVAYGTQQFMSAVAAEAKVAKISEAARLLRDEIVDSQPHGGDHHDEFCPTCQAIRDVEAALNEGDGE